MVSFRRIFFVLNLTALFFVGGEKLVRAESVLGEIDQQIASPITADLLGIQSLEVTVPALAQANDLSQPDSNPTEMPPDGIEPGETAPGMPTPGTPLETPPAESDSGVTLPDPLDPIPETMDTLDTEPQDQTTPDVVAPTTRPGGVLGDPEGETLEPAPLTPRPTTPDALNPDSTEPGSMQMETPGTTWSNPSTEPAPNSEELEFTPEETTPDTTSDDSTDPRILGQEDPLDPDTSDVTFGRSTRSGPSYIGAGANIGLGDGDTSLGEASFSIFSKIGLTSNISVRPAVLFSDNVTILVPLTLDFIPLVTDVTEDVSDELGIRVSPYVGIGAAISTGEDGAVDFLATGGVDIGLSERLTGVVAVNASLFDNPAVGLLLGIALNF